MAVLTLVASTFLTLAYKTGEATTVAPMQYSQMIWDNFYGAFLFGELPDRMTILGSCVIIISGLYVVYRETLSLRSQNTPVLRIVVVRILVFFLELAFRCKSEIVDNLLCMVFLDQCLRQRQREIWLVRNAFAI